MRDYYNYKRLYELNLIRSEYIKNDLKNLNIQIDTINSEIDMIHREYINQPWNDHKVIKNYANKYLEDLEELKHSFEIKLKECKTLLRKITCNINYYDNLINIEISIVNDYIKGIENEKFKKLFPTYEAYKECIINM